MKKTKEDFTKDKNQYTKEKMLNYKRKITKEESNNIQKQKVQKINI